MKKEQENFWEGISLGIALIVGGALLPIFFLSGWSVILSTALIGFGISGMGVELDKKAKSDVFTNIFLGLTFIMIATATVIWKFDNVIVRIVCFIVIILGIFGMFLGISHLITVEKDDNDKNKLNIRISMPHWVAITFSVVGFIADILGIVSFIYK